jgi:Cu/Ag efflux protein CusF
VFAGALLCTLLAAPAAYAQQPAKKAHVFRGKVEKVDERTKTLTVNGDDVPGWMPSMTMVYKVDKEAVLKGLKPGVQITATVYDGDFATLHNVKVVPGAPKK